MREDVSLGNTVLDQIEELRQQMQVMAIGRNLTDPKVIEVSKKLDSQIIEFYLGLSKK